MRHPLDMENPNIDPHLVEAVKVAAPLALFSSFFRLVFDVDGLGFWKGTGTICGGLVAGILAGNIVDQTNLSPLWQHVIICTVGFGARDIAIALIKMLKLYRDNPLKLADDIKNLRLKK